MTLINSADDADVHPEFELKTIQQNWIHPSPAEDDSPPIGRVYLELRRRPAYITHLFLAPSVICGLVNPFIFIVPHRTNAKIWFGKVFSFFGIPSVKMLCSLFLTQYISN